MTAEKHNTKCQPSEAIVLRRLEPSEAQSYSSTHRREGTHDVYDFRATYKISDRDVIWTAAVSFLEAHQNIHGEFEVLSDNVPTVAEQMVHERVCSRIDTGIF